MLNFFNRTGKRRAGRSFCETAAALVSIPALIALLIFTAQCDRPAESVVQDCNLSGFVVAEAGLTVQGLSAADELALLPAETIVDGTGVSSGRFRVSRATSIEQDVLFESGPNSPGDGWVPVGMLVTSTEPRGAEEIVIYKDADTASAPVAQLAPYDAVNMLGCKANWAYIEGTTPEGDPARGWLAPTSQCPNPVTNFS